MLTHDPIAPGEEILATYGSHSNDKLLVHYGFICTASDGGPSPDDGIRLDDLIIPKLEPATRDQLQDVGFLGNYNLSPATNEICFKTEVAVRAALLSSNEWEYFISNGEDLGQDHSRHVRSYIVGIFITYWEDVFDILQKVDLLEDGNADVAKALLNARWEQILNAVQRF
jgi:hypothetical protein